MPIRQWLAAGAGLALLVGLSSCSSLTSSQPVNCNVVKLARRNGQPLSEIAATFNVSEAEVAKCGTGPLDVPGAEQSEGATEAGAAAGGGENGGQSAGGENGGQSSGGDNGGGSGGDNGGASSGKPTM